MKILIHDFAGHPFQLDLSRELANRGHEVTHAYFAEDPGPKGVMQDYRSSSGHVVVRPISVGRPYSKGNFISRLACDLKYRTKIAEVLKAQNFDVVLSSNTPTWVQGSILRNSQSQGAVFVYWCQDFYSIAVGALFKKKLGSIVGGMIDKVLIGWDRHQVAQSDHVINITNAFTRRMEDWCDPNKVSEIHNWGPLDAIPRDLSEADWLASNQIPHDAPRIIYSGTLGLKHNPELINKAAELNPSVTFIVVAAGVGLDALRANLKENVYVLPLQPFEDFPKVLASADLFIAMIEPDAGLYSVPSKVLSYLCAGKPVVLASPAENLAANIIEDACAGVVVDPDTEDGLGLEIKHLLEDETRRESMGLAARAYAEEHFDIRGVADKFEAIFQRIT